MKNIMVVDGAENCVYDIFATPDDDFALIFPDGTDVAFIEDLLNALSSEYCIDGSQVFAAGFSLGGGMVHRLACDRPELFARVGIVAGMYLPCQGQLPAIAFHGDADPIIPYEGGPSTQFENVTFVPVRRVLSEWARTIGCDGLPVISRNGGSIELSTFVNCPGGDGEAQLYTIIGGGHTWPGAAVDLPPDITGPTTQEIDATDLMLDFFLGPEDAPDDASTAVP